MRHCSECGYPLKLIRWGGKDGSDDLLACDRCRAVFASIGAGESVREHCQAWQKHLLTLDEWEKELERLRPS